MFLRCPSGRCLTNDLPELHAGGIKDCVRQHPAELPTVEVHAQDVNFTANFGKFLQLEPWMLIHLDM